jgi:hypothetical protein
VVVAAAAAAMAVIGTKIGQTTVIITAVAIMVVRGVEGEGEDAVVVVVEVEVTAGGREIERERETTIGEEEVLVLVTDREEGTRAGQIGKDVRVDSGTIDKKDGGTRGARVHHRIGVVVSVLRIHHSESLYPPPLPPLRPTLSTRHRRSRRRLFPNHPPPFVYPRKTSSHSLINHSNRRHQQYLLLLSNKNRQRR